MNLATLPLRIALSAYKRGHELPLAFVLRALRPAVAAAVLKSPDDPLTIALLRSIAVRAVSHRDLAMIEQLLAIRAPDFFAQATVEAASEGWRDGYAILRGPLRQLPVPGMSLPAAFLVNDPTAFDRSGPNTCVCEDARDFWDWVLVSGIPGDDAIDFLDRCNLGWTVDYAMRIAHR